MLIGRLDAAFRSLDSAPDPPCRCCYAPNCVAKDRKERERALARARQIASRLPVDASKLDMGNTYSSAPEFYEDRAFVCHDCHVPQTWTAAQQKWWYEEAGGYFFSTAIRCRECRAKERERVAEARKRSGHDHG